MCFYSQQNETLKSLATRFKATPKNPELFLQSDYIIGFEHPKTPIILTETPTLISNDFTWGLIPSWAKDQDIRKNTLNARIETIDEKPSFKNITSNRCLIIATAYFEWHWEDEKGKKKTKYQINSQEDQLFTFAGLYDTWRNPNNSDLLNTYTMLTTQANETMSYVHNMKQRMPIMLKKADETAWLDTANKVQDFAFPYSATLIGFPV